MLVKTTTGFDVYLVNNDKRYLYDIDGNKWERCPQHDQQDPPLIAYRNTKSEVSVIRLTRPEMIRVIDGVQAMRTPTTVDEMRYFIKTLPHKYQRVVDEWTDQQFREVLILAEDRNRNPGTLLEDMIRKTIDDAEAAEKAVQQEQSVVEEATGDSPKPRETREIPRGYRGTRGRRKQEGSVSVALEGISILLTPKQLEFMERLSECPGWEDTGVSGKYIASQYAEELSDTMSSMAVGAVLTTLREKNLLTTEKSRIGGVKCCVFKLTDTGIKVYNELAGNKNG